LGTEKPTEVEDSYKEPVDTETVSVLRNLLI